MIKKILDALQGKAPRGSRRSGSWPKVRGAFLEGNPTCAVCGGKTRLEVHHKTPFYLAPALELEPSNLITLCEGSKLLNCHLLVGHLGHFRSFNVEVEVDASLWNKKISSRP